MPKKKKKPLCQHLRTNKSSYFAQTIFLISRGSAMNLKKCWRICPHWKHQYSVLLQGGHGTFRKLQSCGMHLAYKNEITAEGNINVCLTSCVKCCRFFPSMVCFPAPFHGNGIRRAIPTTDFSPNCFGDVAVQNIQLLYMILRRVEKGIKTGQKFVASSPLFSSCLYMDIILITFRFA